MKISSSAMDDEIDNTMIFNAFYPRGASDAQVLAVIMCVCVCVCVCVCLSHAGIVSKWLNLGSRKQCHVIAQVVQYSDAKSRWCTTPLPPEICDQTDPPPFKNHNFDKYLLIAPQP